MAGTIVRALSPLFGNLVRTPRLIHHRRAQHVGSSLFVDELYLRNGYNKMQSRHGSMAPSLNGSFLVDSLAPSSNSTPDSLLPVNPLLPIYTLTYIYIYTPSIRCLHLFGQYGQGH
jgi:hypothetical protein